MFQPGRAHRIQLLPATTAGAGPVGALLPAAPRPCAGAARGARLFPMPRTALPCVTQDRWQQHNPRAHPHACAPHHRSPVTRTKWPCSVLLPCGFAGRRPDGPVCPDGDGQSASHSAQSKQTKSRGVQISYLYQEEIKQPALPSFRHLVPATEALRQHKGPREINTNVEGERMSSSWEAPQEAPGQRPPRASLPRTNRTRLHHVQIPWATHSTCSAEKSQQPWDVQGP